MQRRLKHAVPPLHQSQLRVLTALTPNFPLSIVAIRAFINIFIKKRVGIECTPKSGSKPNLINPP